MKDPAKPVQLSDRLLDYQSILKRLDIVVSELESVGYVTMSDRDRWEKLIAPERLRASVMLKELGVSPLSRLPSLDAAKALPPVTTYRPLPKSNGVA